jgi:hypothetical protein
MDVKSSGNIFTASSHQAPPKSIRRMRVLLNAAVSLTTRGTSQLAEHVLRAMAQIGINKVGLRNAEKADNLTVPEHKDSLRNADIADNLAVPEPKDSLRNADIADNLPVPEHKDSGNINNAEQPSSETVTDKFADRRAVRDKDLGIGLEEKYLDKLAKYYAANKIKAIKPTFCEAERLNKKALKKYNIDLRVYESALRDAEAKERSEIEKWLKETTLYSAFKNLKDFHDLTKREAIDPKILSKALSSLKDAKSLFEKKIDEMKNNQFFWQEFYVSYQSEIVKAAEGVVSFLEQCLMHAKHIEEELTSASING